MESARLLYVRYTLQNVGWFMCNVASKGYRVAAFEGLPANVRLLRSTLCANPSWGHRALLFAHGLGRKADRYVWLHVFTNYHTLMCSLSLPGDCKLVLACMLAGRHDCTVHRKCAAFMMLKYFVPACTCYACRCYTFSSDSNRGDGFTLCGLSPQQAAAHVATQPGYSLRGQMDVERLDGVLDEDVKVHGA